MKSKNSGIELLRIVLMLFIIIGHLFCHTDIRTAFPVFSAQWFFIWAMQAITVSAVNCFVLITGYFMVATTVKKEKVFRLWGTVWFYSVLIFIVLLIFGMTRISADSLLNAVFPVLRQEYWFFSCYILLYLLIPFLNSAINHLQEKELNFTFFVMVLFFYVLPIFSIVFPQYDSTEGMSILAFISLYFFGAYLRKKEFVLSKAKCIVGLAVNNGLVLISKVLLELIVNKMQMQVGTGLLYHYNSIFQLINAVLLLMLFKQLRLGGRVSKIVSYFSSSVFAIYLIHEQPHIRQLLWRGGMQEVMLSMGGLQFAGWCVLVTAMIFMACFAIDRIRLLLFRFFDLLVKVVKR